MGHLILSLLFLSLNSYRKAQLYLAVFQARLTFLNRINLFLLIIFGLFLQILDPNLQGLFEMIQTMVILHGTSLIGNNIIFHISGSFEFIDLSNLRYNAVKIILIARKT